MLIGQRIIQQLSFLTLLHYNPVFLLSCSQCESTKELSCITNPGPAEDCGSEDKFCSIVKTYVPNLQDDSDANTNDQAGKLISLLRTCSKVEGHTGCAVDTSKAKAVVICSEYCNEAACNSSSHQDFFQFKFLIFIFLFQMKYN
ncbi:uncharacterized protein LOC111714561 [Eurytemora carolleeae]|uniref:uncharacterized protein LOC111714561 n=1 Tax=Eurytemora carolleeae TaxID=1294199 RepID=UPI000C78B29C|nr:uncharacterized protein LOC111714561 [Eurytemora carolleeae]|eukprot:XP_023345466.1 uncharacterized protein LOC111714561 [Eurytemora affinis]